MERFKKIVSTAIGSLSAITTLIVSILPNDYPYRNRVIILAALWIIYGLEILVWKVLKAHRIAIIILLILSALLMGTAVWLYQFRPVILTSKLYVSKDCEDITIRGETITSDTISILNSLRSLSSISFENCTFENEVTSSLNLPQSVINVSLLNCKGTLDFWWLSRLKNLENLTIDNCGLTDANFPNLQTRALRNLHIDNNKGFSELKWLPPSALENISFCNTSVSDLDELARYKSLETICANKSLVSDLSPLANLTKLRSISFNNCRIEAVTIDFMSLRLNSLSVSNNNLSDCSGFQNFTVLVDVDLSYNYLTDVSWLAKSQDTLRSLYLSGNPLDNEGLSFLSSFSHLINLGVSGIKFDSLDFIVNMKSLNTLDAVQCDIDDISAIGEAFPRDKEGREISNTFPENIRLGMNNISDISPLVTILEKAKAAAPAYAKSYVPEFDFLDLSGNTLDGLNVENLSGNTIILDYFPGFSDMEVNFSKIYIVDCPADKRVAIEDLYTGHEKEVLFITPKEALSVNIVQ